jgi:hypothetical protein
VKTHRVLVQSTIFLENISAGIFDGMIENYPMNSRAVNTEFDSPQDRERLPAGFAFFDTVSV